MRNLARITNYYSKQEALKDWQQAVEQARQAGRDDLIERFQFDEAKAGHRTIDRQTGRLKQALQCER